MSDVRKPSPVSLDAVAGVSSGLYTLPALDQFLPGFSTIQRFFSQWLNVDITKFVAVFFLYGVFSSSVSKVSSAIYRWLVRFLTASVSIPASDRLNKEVLLWMSTHVVTQNGTRVLAAQSGRVLGNDFHFMAHMQPGMHMPPPRAMRAGRGVVSKPVNDMPIDYYPSYGSTWFWHQGNLFLFRRCGKQYENFNPDEHWTAPDGQEPIVLLTLGRSPDPIKKFLKTCRDHANQQTERFTAIRMCQDGAHAAWDTCVFRPVRPLETVDLDEGVKTDIVMDMEAYLSPATRRFYARRGIPYRRGYLFYGPPGTGKTSFCLALAGKFNLELYVLNLVDLSDTSGLLRLFAALPPKCIIALEDVDSAGINRELPSKTRRRRHRGTGPPPPPEPSAITLSGLLNALDGLASQEGRVLIMTSNTPDALDKALIRPGRVDKQIHFGFITRPNAEAIFIRMFTKDPDLIHDIEPVQTAQVGKIDGVEEAPPEQRTVSEVCTEEISIEELLQLAKNFAGKIPEDYLTPAEVQGYLLGFKQSPTLALNGVENWLQDLDDQKTRRAEFVKAEKEKAKQEAEAEAEQDEDEAEDDNDEGEAAEGESATKQRYEAPASAPEPAPTSQEDKSKPVPRS